MVCNTCTQTQTPSYAYVLSQNTLLMTVFFSLSIKHILSKYIAYVVVQYVFIYMEKSPFAQI